MKGDREIYEVQIGLRDRCGAHQPGRADGHLKPKTPHDLLKHRCINFRHGSAAVYRWEFDKGKKSLSVVVNGPLVVDDVETLVRAAIDGAGLAFVSDKRVARARGVSLNRFVKRRTTSAHSAFCVKLTSEDRAETGAATLP